VAATLSSKKGNTAMQGSAAIVNDVWWGGSDIEFKERKHHSGNTTVGQDPRSEHAIVFSCWPCELPACCVSKAEVHGGAPICMFRGLFFDALINFAHFDHVFAYLLPL
jgi:hypothetical protein